MREETRVKSLGRGGGREICDEEFRGGAQDLRGCVDGD
jgi:hypothetical protein